MAPNLAAIIQRISNEPGIECVYLLGESEILRKCSTGFTNPTKLVKVHQSFLLFILVYDQQSLRNCEAHLESMSDIQTSIVVWCMETSKYRKALADDEVFAYRIKSSCTKLFPCNNYLIDVQSFSQRQSLSSLPVDHWLNRSREFLAAAELLILRKQMKLAAFCLHQSAEQSYSAILFRHISLRPETHQLTRLHRIAAFFEPEVLQIFPEGITQEESLLHCLQRAYIQARYTDHFSISKELLTQAMENCKTLIKIVSSWSNRFQTDPTPFQAEESEADYILLPPKHFTRRDAFTFINN